MPNQLARAHSAYLRQHADNPVDWREWGAAPFAEARERDCPIFLSIGYAACHWCHVMAHESFEDPAIAARLNASFVSIKVDREERPDVDALYMAATQAMTGGGGWPMSVFLTADGEPFLAGTYFPPVSRHGQPGFLDLLDSVIDAWTTRRPEVLEQASQLAAAASRDIRFVDRITPAAPTRSWSDTVAALADELVAQADPFGGFSAAPKFPRPSYVEALIAHGGAPSWRAATNTLDAMAREGLYDHLGGGFARYSTDREWHVPHFEKMLSDQALLALCYLRADRARGGGTWWRDVAIDTLRFVVRDLLTDVGFASSLDADADGREGSHITWTAAEVRDALSRRHLSADVPAALARWRIEDIGSFEGRSIPRLAAGAPFRTPPELAAAAEALRAERAERPQPGRDDKVVMEWNAMFCAAAFESADPDLEGEAIDQLHSLTETHMVGGRWFRTEGRTAVATAADRAWMIEAHVSAYERTGLDGWLRPLPQWINELLDEHWDGERPTAAQPHSGRGVFLTAKSVTDVRERPKELFDGATPSSHAAVATALARYAAVSGDGDVAAVASRLVDLGGPLIDAHPGAVPDLVRAFSFVGTGRSIVVPGPPNDLTALVRSSFVPGAVVVSGTGHSPLLADRLAGRAYLCEHGRCALPATTTDELRAQLLAWTGTP